MLFKKVNGDTTADSKHVVVRDLEQTNREKHFSSRERHLERPASGAAAAKSKSKGNRKRNSGYCVQWTTTCQCECGMKPDPEKMREPKGIGKGPRPSSSPRRHSLERGAPTGKVLQEKEHQPTCFAFLKGDCPEGNACDHWHPPKCSSHQEGNLQT